MAAKEGVESSNEVCFQRLGALGLEPRDKEHHKRLKRASVLVLLFCRESMNVNDNDDNHQIYTLITKRSMALRSHPGECCFPGGRQDNDDGSDDVQTALREA
jgi:8-oxo-dGTP pyrophosphatase MutT (NUDIX family)